MYFKFEVNHNSPIICNIPHAGTFIPTHLRPDFLLFDEALKYEVLSMADLYTDELYAELAYISSVITPTISRIVIDIERFTDEEKESMSKVGMAALYTKTSAGEALRTITSIRRKELEAIYTEYHNSFTKAVEATLTRYGQAVIVDCHSFPSLPRPYETDQDPHRPDICIGVDDYHTPKELVSFLKESFEKYGYSVKINSPFTGSIVPMHFYQKDKRVSSVMIEVNRKLYMNEKTFKKNEQFASVARIVSRCAIECINRFYVLS